MWVDHRARKGAAYVGYNRDKTAQDISSAAEPTASHSVLQAVRKKPWIAIGPFGLQVSGAVLNGDEDSGILTKDSQLVVSNCRPERVQGLAYIGAPPN